MAKEFGIAPWEVEEGCTVKWYRTHREHITAYNQEVKRKRTLDKKRKKKGKRGNTNRVY